MNHSEKWLAALPVYNESKFVDGVLNEVKQYADHVLVVDDGSTDGTSAVLAARDDIQVLTHPSNRGYGAALITAFDFALNHGFDGIVTLDCDGQHQPKRIPEFIAAARNADLVSGSRYLEFFENDNEPPQERYAINRQITDELNARLGFELTDAFCGFKAYRSEALTQLRISDPGYAMPLQLWVEAAAANLRVVEIPVPLIYLDLDRSFGGVLDEAATRLAYYRRVLDQAIMFAEQSGHLFPSRENCLANASQG
ncbi:glycosyltransferase family 2 protein [Rhodopirellula sp.]|nr:glycosyltransferase family 2 protein [Rhodopirellula sp.]MDB4678750.1 glycosyltransferase family 2 protein [Rhodopirellula sp.]MDB4809828.1 glycosyltransferase family 2 protein [bacterium]